MIDDREWNASPGGLRNQRSQVITEPMAKDKIDTVLIQCAHQNFASDNRCIAQVPASIAQHGPHKGLPSVRPSRLAFDLAPPFLRPQPFQPAAQ